MYRLVNALIYLIAIVYIVAVLFVYVLPFFDFQFVRVEANENITGLSKGDSLLIFPKTIDKIKKDDSVVFKNQQNVSEIRKVQSVSVSSKIITVITVENKIKNITKPVAFDDISGVGIITLHGCAGIVSFLTGFIGKVLVFLLLGVFLIIKFGFGKSKNYA